MKTGLARYLLDPETICILAPSLLDFGWRGIGGINQGRNLCTPAAPGAM
jgi:hypothetical protein